MSSPLQRCNESMNDVLYEDLYSVHMLLDQPKARSFQDISNTLQIECMSTEQLCTDAMGHSRGVLYDSFIDQLHLYKGAAHAASLQAYIQHAAYYLYLAKLWDFQLVQEHMHTVSFLI